MTNDDIIKKCREFANEHKWTDIAKDMEKIIINKLKETNLPTSNPININELLRRIEETKLPRF